MTATIFSLFPEIVEFADAIESPEKHAKFRDRPDLVAGRQRVLNIRHLPAWQLSRAVHVSRYGVRPDFVPQPMASREAMITSAAADRALLGFVEGGSVWPDRWIRIEHLVDDVLGLIEEQTEVTPEKRKQVLALAPQNVGHNYERDLSAWFTDDMVRRMYEHNPLWRRAEDLAYGRSPQ